MPSILEVVREYKDLADRKRAEGALPADLAERFAQLEVLVRQYRDEQRAAKVTADLSAPSAPARAASLARPRRDSQPERPAARRASEVRSSPPVRASVDNGVAVLALEVPTPPAELGAAGWWKALQNRLHVPQDPGARRRLLIALAVMSAGLAVACTVMMGADPMRLLPGLLVTGGVGWFLVMPLVMATWEFRGRRSNAHISEPDFEVLLPTPEPAVGVLTLLAAMVWVMTSGLPSEGLARTAGYILGLGFGLAAMGMLGMLILRPVAAKIAVARAYAQYMAGGQHHLARNPRRARRLFERAAQAARTEEEREAAQVKLRAAVEREAAELAERGLSAHASALLQTAEPAPIPRPAPVRGIKNSKTVAPVRPAPSGPVGPPRVLSLGAVEISDAPDSEEQSRLLLRGRAREALEAALDARAPVSEAMARAAAQEYIAQGCLRSAFTLFEALGEAQIPEFYKALAVEISRALDKPDLPLATRVSQLLDGLGEGESVARLATQVVLATEGDGPLRHDLAAMARRTCESIGARPAGGVLEALGELSEAAAAYEVEGAAEDAQRCLRLRADQLLAAGDGAQAVPILARLFSLDPSLEDEYLAPLVENIIDSGATGSRASKILAAQRRRHPDDVRTLSRRVELFVEAGQVNEARAELDHLAKVSGSSTEQVVQQYQTLVARYPRDAALRAGLCRVLIRVARASDAAQHVARLMESEYRQRNAKELAELIESVYQWGHQDPDLRLGLARVRAEMGMRQEALQVIITYLKEGGRNPEALELGQSLLADELVLPSGAPNHKAHLELAVLNLYAGVPGDAIRLLEVARAGGEQRARAEILLARAHQLASNPGQAVRILVESIGGRPLRQTPEQHFELARAYEAMGEDARAKKVDAALERAIPGSVRDFRARREVFERADTIWDPAPGLEEPNDTDAGTLGTELGTGSLSEHPAAATVSDVGAGLLADPPQVANPGPDLAQVLLPRYRLDRRIGSGGMGDVHLAKDLALDRDVAIKVLRRTLATDLFIAKFKEEARTVAKLSHPGIVGVYDIGQSGDWSYIVMEYVRGPNLSMLLKASAPPARRDIVRYMAQVADAMDYAHGQGVVHRDLKPANLLVSLEGQVKVTDFGIAHILQDRDEKTAFAAAGMQVGTVNYMAPEQVTGGRIGPPTDIYLLGTTVFFCLSRNYPYGGHLPLLAKVQEDAAPLRSLLPDVSPELDLAVNRALARQPEARHASMGAFAAALRATPEFRGA